MVVWTDHKNLAYLEVATRLNARQARSALFFARFTLTITYRPSSRNTKADALSCHFAPDLDSEEKDKPILPPSCIVGALTWEIERVIRDVQEQEHSHPLGSHCQVCLPPW